MIEQEYIIKVKVEGDDVIDWSPYITEKLEDLGCIGYEVFKGEV